MQRELVDDARRVADPFDQRLRVVRQRLVKEVEQRLLERSDEPGHLGGRDAALGTALRYVVQHLADLVPGRVAEIEIAFGRAFFARAGERGEQCTALLRRLLGGDQVRPLDALVGLDFQPVGQNLLEPRLQG